MIEMNRIAVVGASLAGLRAVEFIRRAKFEGQLALIGDETHLPYDRPPLSKEVLRGEWEPDRLALRRKSYDDLNVDLMLGQRAVSLDTDAREVQLESGDTISFDGMVIATGGHVCGLRRGVILRRSHIHRGARTLKRMTLPGRSRAGQLRAAT